jgi:two-component system response regulator HydG
MKFNILIIDDDVDICILLQKFLEKKGFDVDTIYSSGKVLNKFKEKNYDCVLCDYRLGDEDGKDVLIKIKDAYPQTMVVIMTAYSDIRTAVNVIKLGAFDYITKPLVPDELLNIINKALNCPDKADKKTISSDDERVRPRVQKSDYGEFLVGTSPAIRKLYKHVEVIAPTNYSVILYGESGSGKEVIAKTIHKESNRRDKPFIALDCGTLSKELANSELFGHMKGSFTGAYYDKKGHFELANGGTLFLDEVANLSYDIQAALLRVIQERKLKRIGGTTEMDLDIRIIVASHENLRRAYEKGEFREDLFHRLNEFSINVPSLKERKEDIPSFAHFFLEKTNAELDKNITGFEDNVMDIFINYSWPGNLREFRNVIRKAVLLTPSGKITLHSLPPEITNPPVIVSSTGISDTIGQLNIDPLNTNLKNVSSEIEYHTILQVLKSVNYNKAKAANILNIDRKTLYNKLKNHDA